MNNKRRTMLHCIGMVFHRRVTLILIVCTVVVFCFKISLNPSTFKMAYSVDFRHRERPGLPGNNSYGNSLLLSKTMRTFSPDGKIENLAERLFDSQENEQQSTETTETTHLSSTSGQEILNPFNARIKDIKSTNSNSSYQFSKKYSNTINDTLKAAGIYSHSITNNTRPLRPVRKRHPNQDDYLKIASGKYIPEDLMKLGPFTFLENYRNPCWKNSKRNLLAQPVRLYSKRNLLEPPIRCLPFFYLIGAPKSGTTDLFRRLVQHPEISKFVTKEPHWLTRKHFYSLGGLKTRSNLTDYLRYFSSATREAYVKKDSKGYHNMIFGDCSASTLWDNDYWTILPEFRHLTEPLYTNADYIHHLNPNTKIIAMLRNPVDRLYSDYMYFQHGSPRLFHNGVEKVINDTYECLNDKSLRHCLYTPPKSFSDIEIRLRIGVYHLHLKEYLRVFPRDQVLVIRLEHFSKNTTSYMQKIFSFLELSTLKEDDLVRIADPNRRANPRRKKDKIVGEMLPETRKLLSDFYRPHNKFLVELLGEPFNYNRDIL